MLTLTRPPSVDKRIDAAPRVRAPREKNMILLWGDPDDPPIHQVREALRQLGQPAFLVDCRQLPATEFEVCTDDAVRGCVRTLDSSIRLEEITAAYLRPGDFSGADSPIWRKAMEVTERLFIWSELTTARVVNRPRAMAANHSKPYQLSKIRPHGFETPDTIVTTDPEAALEFWKRHGRVIYKSASGVRSIVAQLGPEHRDRLTDVVWCPTQFQEYVEGCDFRVHVVGREVFACEIDCDADDYRYGAVHGKEAAIHGCELPDDVSRRCIQMVSSMQLELGGVDLRRTPDGRWYCFEVNPSPGFTFFGGQTGQPIARAVAELLAGTSPIRPAPIADRIS
jgi:glutathione synthase/RimK-type ligase-like ATP-grasp enzyme